MKLIKTILYVISINILIVFSSISLYSQWKKVEITDSDYQNIYWLDVFFLNSSPNYGWVCGFGGCVMRTSDQGKTWNGTKIQEMKINPVIDSSGVVVGFDTSYVPLVNQLESIQFVDSLVGYTSGEDKAFKSTDGGISWELISKPGMRIWGLFFLTKDIGMVIGGGCDNYQEFYRTEDGGKTWANSQYFENVSGLSDLILYSINGLGYASSSGLIWRTTDGGKDWDVYSVSGERDWQEELTNINQTFLVPYSKGCWGGSADGGLRMSIDNGRNWRQFNTSSSMFGAFLLDSQRGWGCGNNNSIYYTSDGGKTWDLKNCGLEPATNLDDLWFINDTLGFVVGRGIYRTHFYDTTYSHIANDGTKLICQGDSLLLKAADNYRYHKWSTGDTINAIYVKQKGWYYLSSYNNPCDYIYEDSVYIDIAPEPDLQILTNKSFDFCKGDSILLWVNTAHQEIYWSTGDKTDTILVSKSGEYKVRIKDVNGCEYSKSVTLIVHPLPNVEIEGTGKATFCIGDSIILRTKSSYDSYYWFNTINPDSMLSDNRSYVAQSSGSYSVIVRDKWGCEAIADSYIITVLILNNNLSLKYKAASEIVEFDSVKLTEMKCIPLTIYNISNKIFVLYDVLLKHNIEFSIPQSQFPYTILSGDSMKLTICYRPLQLKTDRDTIIIADTCRPHNIPLLGFGSSNIYKVKGENKNCDVDLEFETIGLVSDEYFDKINIFPNPASEFISVKISLNKSEKSDIRAYLYNITGILVDKGELSYSNINDIKGETFQKADILFNTSKLENGIYFIQVSINGSLQTYKVTIIK